MRGFGELEATIMDRMWSRGGSATVRDVYEELRAGRDIAYTTVMTVMDNLHRKGWLDRERDGRAWRYRPTTSREEYAADLMREALGHTSDPTTAFAHFLSGISEEDSHALRSAMRRVARRRKP